MRNGGVRAFSGGRAGGTSRAGESKSKSKSEIKSKSKSKSKSNLSLSLTLEPGACCQLSSGMGHVLCYLTMFFSFLQTVFRAEVLHLQVAESKAGLRGCLICIREAFSVVLTSGMT